MARTDAPQGRAADPEAGEEVILGHITGVFGLKGELRVFLHNRESDLLHTPRRVMLEQEGRPRRPAMLQIRPGAGRRIIGRIDGVRTPEAAEALVGARIFFPKAELPDLEEDTYYHHQLIGLPVRTASGELLGHIHEISSTTEIDIWVVHSPDGEEIFIPATEDEIVSVTIGEGIVVAD